MPGYIVNERVDALDPTNLLLLEATPSGVVARPLKDRLEQSTANNIMLLQVCSPAEKRNGAGMDDLSDTTARSEMVDQQRTYLENELAKYRDTQIASGEAVGYSNIHSTITIGGAVAYKLGLRHLGAVLNDKAAAPMSMCAYLVLKGLQQAAAAQQVNESEVLQTVPGHFARDYRFFDNKAVRLRPGWRFLPPILLKVGSAATLGRR